MRRQHARVECRRCVRCRAGIAVRHGACAGVVTSRSRIPGPVPPIRHMPHTSEETARLLVRRMRAGLWILLLALVLFGLKLVALRQGDGAILIGLKAVQLATVLGMFWLL